MLTFYEENENMIFLISDVAHFHLNGTVNKQNSHYWAADNPSETHQKPIHAQKLKIGARWERIASLVLIFLKQNGATVTVTVEGYIEMIKTFLYQS